MLFSYLGKPLKEILSPKYLKEDLFAGFNIAIVAIPLALAIGLASSVPPGRAGELAERDRPDCAAFATGAEATRHHGCALHVADVQSRRPLLHAGVVQHADGNGAG